MANDKRFIAKNGLQTQNTRYLSPDNSQASIISIDNNGNLTVDAGASSNFGVIATNAGVAELGAYGAPGSAQSTGVIYAGQDPDFGGGIFYNGDGTPAYATGESADRVSLFRRTAGANHVVMSYGYTSNNVAFTGTISGNGSGLTNVAAVTASKWATARTLTLTGAVTGNASIDGSGNVSLATAATSDPTITLAGDATGSVTLTNLNSGTLTVTVDGGNAQTLDNLNSTDFTLDRVTGHGATTTNSISVGNITTSGYLRGPGTFTIDPSPYNSPSGTLVINGDLQVNGTTTTINSTTLAVDDKNIEIASGSTNSGAADGAGITVDLGSDGTTSLTYVSSTDRWTFDKNVQATTFVGALSGNASTASKWATARTLTLTGAVTGNASIDGSGNVSLATTATSDPTLTLNGDVSGAATFTNLGNATLTVTVENDSHTHSFNNLTSKTAGTGDYSTTGNIETGRGSGGVALTVNDSQGNANVTFNHANGSAEQAGNVGRIEVNTDATTGSYMAFHIADNAATGTVTAPEIFRVTPAGADLVAGTYNGNGSGLTNVDAVTLNGNNSAYYTNASNLSSGTVPTARLPASALTGDTNYYLSGLSFNTADGILTATVSGAANQTVDLDGRYLLSGAKAADSELLDGFNSSQTSTPSTVAVRDNSGDINARLFKSEFDSTNSNINFIMTQIDTATNNYIRPSTPAQFRAAVTDGVYLGVTAKAADSDLLDGNDSAYYTNASNLSSGTVPTARLPASALVGDTNYYLSGLSFNTADGILTATVNGATNQTVDLDGRYLLSTGTAANSALLDNLDSTEFLRSNANDTASGVITFSNTIEMADQLRHVGDTDTYIQFPAANQWRVVTGGASRLDVSDTEVTVQNSLNIPSAGGTVGSNATRNLTISTAEPTGGNDGDVWYQYE